MSKKNLLTSALVLSTLAATATPSVVSAATTNDADSATSQTSTEQVNNKSEDNSQTSLPVQRLKKPIQQLLHQLLFKLPVNQLIMH
jgi:hypothetical protein